MLRCGSFPEERTGWNANVRAMVDERGGWFVPYLETCMFEKLTWARTAAQRSFEKRPVTEDDKTLIAELAEHGIGF